MSIPFFKFFLANAKSQCEKLRGIQYAQCVRVRPSEIYYSMRRRSPNRSNQKIHSLFIVSFTVPLLDCLNYSTNRFICQALISLNQKILLYKAKTAQVTQNIIFVNILITLFLNFWYYYNTKGVVVSTPFFNLPKYLALKNNTHSAFQTGYETSYHLILECR